VFKADAGPLSRISRVLGWPVAALLRRSPVPWLLRATSVLRRLPVLWGGSARRRLPVLWLLRATSVLWRLPVLWGGSARRRLLVPWLLRVTSVLRAGFARRRLRVLRRLVLGGAPVRPTMPRQPAAPSRLARSGL
jgi:hypothetical protein